MTELLMAVTTVGTVATLSMPHYIDAMEKARSVEAIVMIGALKNSEFAHRLGAGSYTDHIDKLFVKVPSSNFFYWTYELSGASPDGFTITATRTLKKAGEGIAGQTIVFGWNDDTAEKWSGTHTGVPE